jgi:hypothetical protein
MNNVSRGGAMNHIYRILPCGLLVWMNVDRIIRRERGRSPFRSRVVGAAFRKFVMAVSQASCCTAPRQPWKGCLGEVEIRGRQNDVHCAGEHGVLIIQHESTAQRL